MSKLNPISHRDFVRKLRLFGFEEPHVGGKHLYMLKADIRLTIPNPHKQKIGVSLLIRLLKQTEITRDKWIKKG